METNVEEFGISYPGVEETHATRADEAMAGARVTFVKSRPCENPRSDSLVGNVVGNFIENCGTSEDSSDKVPVPRSGRDPDKGQKEYFSRTLKRPAIRLLTSWVADLKSAWSQRRDRSFDLPILVWKAKSTLGRGQWTDLFRSDEMPFGKRKGEMLARTGRWLSRLNAQTFAHLPEGWSVLDVLTCLSLIALERHIADGNVHPAMTLAEARMLVGKESSNARRTQVMRQLIKFNDFVSATSDSWSLEERRYAAAIGARILATLVRVETASISQGML